MWKTPGAPTCAVSPAGPRAAAAAVCLLLTGLLVVTVGHPEDQPAANGKAFSAYFKKLTRERRAVRGPAPSRVSPGPVEHVSPTDLFIAVKTTGRYHQQRLELLLDTWMSRNMQQVSSPGPVMIGLTV